MNIISARGEKNLTEIARRVFQISGARGTAAERAAVAALTRANPQLAPDQPVEAGTPVFVPPSAHDEAPGAGAESLDEVKTAVAQLRDALGRVGKELDGALAAPAKDDEALLAALKEHARELNGASDEAAARSKEIQKAAKTRKEATAKQVKEQRAAIAQFGEDLDAFLKLF